MSPLFFRRAPSPDAMITHVLLILFAINCAASSHEACVLDDVSSMEANAARDVKHAQEAWGIALVSIGKERTQGGDYAALATESLQSLYAFGFAKSVLFKPTMSQYPVFRNSFDGAVSYFVGGNDAFPSDTGFAFKNWTSVECASHRIVTIGDVLLTNGNCALTDATNSTTFVDKSFVYIRDATTRLRIILHHSSLPVAPVNALSFKTTVVAAKFADLMNSTSLVNKEEVRDALQKWTRGLMNISLAHRFGYDYKGAATNVINDLYAFDAPSFAPLALFKPTLAKDPPMRNDFEGALSYFVGGNVNFSSDTGFAIKGWTDVQCTTTGFLSLPGMAFANGNCFFTASDGSVTKADKSWGYMRDGEGSLKIVLHHSSLPYVPTAVTAGTATEAIKACSTKSASEALPDLSATM